MVLSRKYHFRSIVAIFSKNRCWYLWQRLGVLIQFPCLGMKIGPGVPEGTIYKKLGMGLIFGLGFSLGLGSGPRYDPNKIWMLDWAHWFFIHTGTWIVNAQCYKSTTCGAPPIMDEGGDWNIQMGPSPYIKFIVNSIILTIWSIALKFNGV